MHITQGLKRAIQTNQNGLATIEGEHSCTWECFGDRVARLAGALQNLGLCQDSRVAILSLNGTHYLETYYAVRWADGIIVPLNVRLAPIELLYMLNDAAVEILIIDTAFRELLPTLLAGATFLKHVLYVGTDDRPQNTISYEQALQEAMAIPDVLRAATKLPASSIPAAQPVFPKALC